MNNTNTKKTKTFNKTSVEIGARIAARRKQLGLTQEKASEEADLSYQFFACVERGLKSMRAKNIIKVAKALDISTDYLLTGVMNEADDNRLSTMLKPLTPEERLHLEDIIKNYLWACGYDL